MKPWERFIEYAKILTPSNEDSGTVPSSPEQFDLAKLLVKELKDMGVDARLEDNCYVYGKLPATKGLENKPGLGWIAHMDTVSDFADHEIKPIVHENYDGGELALGDSGRVLSLKQFPHLKSLKGRSLITSDGTTVLGADDKAGVAEIMSMVEYIIENDIPHCSLSIGFTPDEEIGSGADHFDVEGFGADFAYTVDGGTEGEIEYENFNAASAKLTFTGVNVHPGSAKDIMINAARTAAEYAMMLPESETPAATENYEGFYHLTDMNGEVAEAVLKYIVRDHDYEKLLMRKAVMEECAAAVNKKYGEGTVTFEWKEQYRNMSEIIRENMHLIENAQKAAQNIGIEPRVIPIRGGTDGARLSFMGLPCPNLGTGGYAFHGPYEHITKEGMETAMKMMLEIVKLYS